MPGPWLYLNYTGWIAVLFGVIGSGFLWSKGQHPLALFLILWATGALWLSSAMPFEWLSSVSDPFPSVVDFLAGLRWPSLLAGLAVPALLALAAAGLECLLEWSRSHSRFWLTSEKDGVLVRHLRLPLSIIVLVIAILSLMDLRSFSKDWIRTVTVDQSTITPVLERLETPSLQWVQTPLGEMWWVLWSIEYGLKIADTWSPWHIEGHDPPRPYLASARGEVPAVAEIIGTPIGDITTYQENDVQHYASVIHQDGARSACSAAGRGGHLEVTCEVEQPGQLVVLENNLGSWNADVNGTDSSVEKNGQWVAVNVLAGDLTIELRYRPWDVWLGLVLMIIGVVWATVWLVAPDRHWLPPNISSSLEQRLDVIWQRLRPNSQKDEG